MSLTTQDLNQINTLIKKAFGEFISETFLPALSHFVTKQEFNDRLTPIEEDIKVMKADIAFLKDQYVGAKTDVELEITRAKSTDHYLLQEINEVRGRMNLPPLDFFSAAGL